MKPTRKIIRQVAITIFFGAFGLLLPSLIEMTFDIELSKIITAIIALPFI